MSAAEFWSIIDRVHAQAGPDLGLRIKFLRDDLMTRDLDEIRSFQRQYDAQLAKSYRWDLWGACVVMNGGCSDDGFQYFRDWLISEGSHTFEAALKQPDSLAELARVRLADNESFGYVARGVYASKHGGELAPTPGDPSQGSEPLGKEWQEDDLPQMFPRLGEKYLSMQPEDAEPRL